MKNKQKGMIAATYTPFYEDGSLRLDSIPPMVNHLVNTGVNGIFICGSTGEGLNLTQEERMTVAEHYVEAARGRLTNIVHVGHHSIDDAKRLARHAQEIGADGFAAFAPSYYPVSDNKTLIESIRRVADGAPDLPFYYYHIPPLTGIKTCLHELLSIATDMIPNLTGVKFTDAHLDQFMICRQDFESRIDMVWGVDELMLGALAMGAQAFIGSTYNYAAPLYAAIERNHQNGDAAHAQQLQGIAIRMVRLISTLPFHPSVKMLLTKIGIPMGPARAPLYNPTQDEFDNVWERLSEIGATEWIPALPLQNTENPQATRARQAYIPNIIGNKKAQSGSEAAARRGQGSNSEAQA